jgi:8-oxo-dGTP diphosphatase
MQQQKQNLVVTCLVRNSEGQIILIRHFRRGWELPQGRVEAGETLSGAVRREVKEETGVEIDLGPLAVVWSKTCEPTAEIFGFTARYVEGELTPSEESPEVRWFSPDEALSTVSHQVNLERLQSLLNPSAGIVHHAYQTRPFMRLQPSPVQKLAVETFLAAYIMPRLADPTK